MSKKNFITLGQLIDNEPFEIEIPGMGIAKVRFPTKQESIEAEREIREEYSNVWNQLTATKRTDLIIKRTMLKALVEPKIDKKNYLKCKDVEIDYLLDTVSLHIAKRLRTLLDKRKAVLRDFLGPEMEENL